MQIKEWLQRDKYSLGFILGLLIPIPTSFVIIVIVSLLQSKYNILENVRQLNLLLLGIAFNLVAMRYYLVNLKFYKTGQALLVTSAILVLLFFLFLKNSNFTFPI